MTPPLLTLQALRATAPAGGRVRRSVEPRREQAVCYHCASSDTMEPFARSERIFLLTRILPHVRRRYCRACTRHFVAYIK